ncbi:unnamed protein product, partial [Oppiella nova]
MVCSKHLSQSAQCLQNPIRIAVVGSGPSGLRILGSHKHLYILFKRQGKPNHAKPQRGLVVCQLNVINSFTTTALNKRVTFMGNISIGSDISLQQIRDNYNAVVLCYGAAQDRKLNIEGEDVSHVISARRFVGWYNGVPDDRDLDIDLNCETAVIIGQGNVAIDCARILLTDSQQILSNTDITKHSLEKLSKSNIKNVYIIGRRGPMQVSFTIKEFRELTKLMNCKTIMSSEECDQIPQTILESLERPKKRLTELIIKVSKESSTDVEKNAKK